MKTALALLASAGGILIVSCLADWARRGDVFLPTSASGGALVIFLVVALVTGIIAALRAARRAVARRVG